MKNTNKYASLALLAIVLVSCFPKPITYLPKPNELSEYTKGMWIDCHLNNGTEVAGEIIVVENDALTLVTKYKVPRKVTQNEISKAFVEVSMTSNEPEKLSKSGLIPLLTLAHGYWAFFSLPINLVAVSTTVNTHKRGSYAFEYPAKITWSELHKYARFPQGLPEGVSYNQIIEIYQ